MVGKIFTLVTLFLLCITCGFFALAGYSSSASEIYSYWHPASRIPGNRPDLFNAGMTAVMATLFAGVSVLLLWWRKRIQGRLRGNVARILQY